MFFIDTSGPASVINSHRAFDARNSILVIEAGHPLEIGQFSNWHKSMFVNDAV